MTGMYENQNQVEPRNRRNGNRNGAATGIEPARVTADELRLETGQGDSCEPTVGTTRPRHGRLRLSSAATSSGSGRGGAEVRAIVLYSAHGDAAHWVDRRRALRSTSQATSAAASPWGTRWTAATSSCISSQIAVPHSTSIAPSSRPTPSGPRVAQACRRTRSAWSRLSSVYGWPGVPITEPPGRGPVAAARSCGPARAQLHPLAGPARHRGAAVQHLRAAPVGALCDPDDHLAGAGRRRDQARLTGAAAGLQLRHGHRQGLHPPRHQRPHPGRESARRGGTSPSRSWSSSSRTSWTVS
jgi:hypothetical protein